MEADANYNKTKAFRFEVQAQAMRSRLEHQSTPVVLEFRTASLRRLRVYLSDREAKSLAAELYAQSDKGE